jgi:hypothetical protein
MLHIRHICLLCSIVILAVFCFAIPKSAYSVTPPDTTISIDASAVMGSNSWYTSAVPITFTATAGTNPVKSITYWIDSGTPTTVNSSTATTTLIQQGTHTLYYYATDTQDVTESQKSFEHKIDLAAPYNWSSFTVVNSGNSHTFTITVNVQDKTSGLDNAAAEFQYSVDEGSNWGYYSTLTNCGSTWNNNLWRTVTITPNTAGTLTATVNIPSTDYCNSNWSNTKYLRIRIKDMAGLQSTKQYALMAPWMQTSGGDIFSDGNIDMTTEGSPSSNGVVMTNSNTINNLTSSQGWYVRDYNYAIQSYYMDYYNKLGSSAQALPSTLPTTSGIYYSTDLNITSTKLPAALATTQNLALVIFVYGDLYIDTNVTLHSTSSIVWVASDDLGIKNSVTRADGFFISGGDFSSSYNGGSSNQLTINGGVLSLGDLEFPRSLSGTTNLTTPAEVINYNPSILINYNMLNLFRVSPNLTWKEVIQY